MVSDDFDRCFSKLSDEELLDALDAERRKFTKSDDELMMLMVDELVRRSVYPATGNKLVPTTAFKMMEGYGARWHLWHEPLKCPHCNADLRDTKAGPPFQRVIGLYDRARDMTTAYQCPDCKNTWPR